MAQSPTIYVRLKSEGAVRFPFVCEFFSKEKHETEVNCKSSKTIKIGKVKIVAILALIEKLLQMTYNSTFDLANVDREYREHI